MRSRLARCICLSLALVLCTVLVAAHSGGTDSKGGHYNHSTGEYHYHHGYPAHQHTGGVCPYDFDNETGQSNGSSGVNGNLNGKSSVSDITSNASFTFGQHSDISSDDDSVWLLFLIAVFVLSPVFSAIYDYRAKKKRNAEIAEVIKATEFATLQRSCKEKLDRERTEFLRAYQGHRLSEAVPPPNVDDHIGPDGLPCGDGTGRWGTAYTVYVTYHSKVYHRRSVCGTACGTPTNITRTYGLRPCSRCCKSAPPDLTWYYEQQRLLQKSQQLFGRSIFTDK